MGRASKIAMSSSPDRPLVFVNFASTIDGKITAARELAVGSLPLSRHQEDPRRMRVLRASADAILIGASNLRVDDPDLALATEERARRRAAGEEEPRRLVITRQGEGIEARQKMFDRSRGGPAYVVHSEDMPAATRARLGKVAALVAMGATAVDMAQMLTWMKRDLGVRALLCEGGGVLTAQLFAARAVDQLYVTFVPRILGGEHAPTMVEGAGFAPDLIPDATIGSLERIGDELFVRYDFVWS